MIITSTEKSQWQKGKEASGNKINGTVSFGNEGQTVRGFGGCFNELGKIALEKLSSEEKREAMSALFSEEGCNFEFCRMPIGASDYSEIWYSCNETEGDLEMKNFSIERDRKYLLPYIKEAMEYKPEMKLFASPWSPPTWMKTHKVNNFGRLIQTDENLKAYALYFKKFVEAYKEEGITIEQIHIQNEPCSSQKFPSCRWSGEEFRNFISAMSFRALPIYFWER